MKASPLDHHVAKTIRTNRITRQIKQVEMAAALNMSRTNYGRLEKGEWAISLGQLEIIARVFNTTLIQLLLASKDTTGKSFDRNSLFRTQLSIMLLLNGYGAEMDYSSKELNFLIEEIKAFYLKQNPDLQ